MLCQVKCLKRKACDAGVDIASRGREGALTVIREGVGVGVLLWYRLD